MIKSCLLQLRVTSIRRVKCCVHLKTFSARTCAIQIRLVQALGEAWLNKACWSSQMHHHHLNLFKVWILCLSSPTKVTPSARRFQKSPSQIFIHLRPFGNIKHFKNDPWGQLFSALIQLAPRQGTWATHMCFSGQRTLISISNLAQCRT